MPIDESSMLSILQGLRESPGMKRMAEGTEIADRNGFDKDAVAKIVAGITTLISEHEAQEVANFIQATLEGAVATQDFARSMGIRT